MFRYAKETIERYGFDSREFNQITLSQQTDRELQKRLQQKVAGIRASQGKREAK
jgi:thioesterase domain-containing protein